MKSLQSLNCEYLDLYLIHWPGVQKLKSDDPRNAELRRESWKALEKLCKAGQNFWFTTFQFIQYLNNIYFVLKTALHNKLP